MDVINTITHVLAIFNSYKGNSLSHKVLKCYSKGQSDSSLGSCDSM
jgi:hypothetical protein